MGKRRISHQQRTRIENRQARHVQHVKDKKAITESIKHESDSDNKELHPGLILANLGKTAEVECKDGSIIQCQCRQHLGVLVPGDQIVWQQDAEQHEPVIVAVEPRRSQLMRFSQRGEAKPMAANLDQLIIMLAPNPPPHWALLDRYLVLASFYGLDPVIVLNKSDCLDDEKSQSLSKELNTLSKLGYPVIYTSVVNKTGIDALKQQLTNKISTFVGQSGVGKSALASILMPDKDIRVAADEETESSNPRLGKHTTTTARYYHLPFGGDLIDSPGVRVMHMHGLEHEDIEAGFKDIKALSQHCQFRNCQHQKEKGCAVLEALESGELSARRYQSFVTIKE